MMKKILLILTLTAAGALFTVDASAYRGRPGPPPRNHGPFFGDVERMRDVLDLTTKQVTQIRDINEKYRRRMEPFDKKLRPLHQQLRQLLLKKKVDINSIRRKLKEISDVEIELKILQIRHRKELKKILTSEQLEELQRERRNMRRRHHRRMGPPQGGRKGRFND